MNQSVSGDGVTVTLNSVILDENELIVSTTEVYTQPREEWETGLMGDVQINGVWASDGSAGGSKAIDAHTVESVITFRLDNIDVNQELSIKIRFYENYEDSSGLEFQFFADGEQLAADTETIELVHQYQLPDGSGITRY